MNRERFVFFFFRSVTWLALLFIAGVFLLLFKSGASAISWKFLTSVWQHQDITRGGIIQPMIGSLLLGTGVTILSFPLGLSAAIYLTEYNRSVFWRRIVQLTVRNLSGVPSVIYGLFGVAVFVHFLSLGSSLLSAMLTLSVMTIPWIFTASYEALTTIPLAVRESSVALGATRWQTIKNVIIPIALPGCITGAIIGIARAMGETAPIIFVGATFYLSSLPTSLLDKFMALPYHTFILSTQHSSPNAIQYASATALVLIAFTFLLSAGAILLRFHLRQARRGI